MIVKRYFKCSVCGTISPATSTKKKTVAGHIKTFYCYSCKRVTDMVQEA